MLSTPHESDSGPSARSVLDAGAPTMRFQPIVDLTQDSCPVVAFEALARWPALPDLRIDALFSGTHGADLDELDWTCRLSTIDTVRRLAPTVPPVFLNVEPTSAHTPPPLGTGSAWAEQLWTAAADLPLVLEITERAVAARPADLLRVVSAARERGWRVALDDVGARRASIAMIDLVRPDVVKLDVALLRPESEAEHTRTLLEVHAYCERSGAVILAEGIESLRMLETARSLGATLGQGWAFGRPGPLRAADRPITLPDHGVDPVTPFTLLDEGHDEGAHPVRTARRPLLLSMTHDIEQRAIDSPEPAIVLGAFQDAGNVTGTVRDRYSRIASTSAFTAMLGAGMPASPAPGVVGLPIEPDDPTRREWAVVVIGSSYCAALVAQDVGDVGPQDRHRFRWRITQDRDAVTAAARALLVRTVVSWPAP